MEKSLGDSPAYLAYEACCCLAPQAIQLFVAVNVLKFSK
jgi:hypothetical protein